MIKKKFIFNSCAVLAISFIGYSVCKNISNESITESSVTIEDLINDTNFKLEFKNLNELEFTMQDSTIDIKNTSLNKTFSNNDKFDIVINESNKITAINFTSTFDKLDTTDIEYLKKTYTFVFDSLSEFLFQQSTDMLKKVQSSEYISSNKNTITDNGYTIESIPLKTTSELKFTTYYKKINNKFKPHKVILSILQGNKN